MIKNSQNCNFASNFASCQNSNLTITYRSIYYWPVYILQDMDILDHRESNMLWMAGKCLADNLQLDRCNGMTPMYSNNGMDMVIIPHIHRYLNSCKLAAVKNHSRSLRKSTFSTNRNVRWHWFFGKLSIWTRILQVYKSKQLCKCNFMQFLTNAFSVWFLESVMTNAFIWSITVWTDLICGTIVGTCFAFIDIFTIWTTKKIS